ncbi:hypothetical protein D3C80_1733920 [compost metagenome]
MKGLSSTALQKTTSLAQPMESRSLVRSAVWIMMSPISFTASMLIPLREEPTLTEEHTRSVTARASGMLSIRIRSPLVQPFCTSAENPPIKLTPTSLAALSRISATGT